MQPHDPTWFAVQIGCGVAAFQIMKHHDIDSECFFVIRTDGSREDFSIRKSVASLFPEWAKANPPKATARIPDRGRGRGVSLVHVEAEFKCSVSGAINSAHLV